MSLQTKHLSVSYGTAPIIRDFSEPFKTGQVTALIGCNGAGKSTLFKAMAGLSPMKGHLLFAEHLLTAAEQRQHIAYMPQDTDATSSLTVLEVVLLGRLGKLGMRLPTSLVGEATTALQTFGLATLENRTLNEISGGQRQLVYLAQALFRTPKVLLLDEPTAALDLRHQLLVLDRVRTYARDSGACVAIALHDLTLAAQFSDRLIGLKDGLVVAAGTASDVLTQQNLQAMYGIKADISRGPSGKIQVTPLHAV
ncbi:ABC transporter ATP-binding protein [Pseudophaeobacter leonis]|uniref:ABC transporter ATP-binding protein n=1 Tax=Pseudophaeobacter leonis TaxID=1144477 RepID=UPI00137481B9|nr:ABC transporter ATP-binding protein [Pseudophaeobacter leonis]